MRFAALVLAAAVLSPSLATAQTARGDGYTPVATLVSGPEEGRTAPGFTLPWASKDTTSVEAYGYTLREDRGKVVVLAFYPRDFTNRSIAQFRSFARQYDELFGSGVVVFGISSDPVETHRQFAASLDLPFRLLSDGDQRVARAYGSRSSDAVPTRTVYVIGRDGKVTYRDLQFDPSNPRALSHLKTAVQAARDG